MSRAEFLGRLGFGNQQMSWYRYRGATNDRLTNSIPPQGYQAGSDRSSGRTIDRVVDGMYMPGFGVGMPAPERVVGGFHLPGYGVTGGRNNFNGPIVRENVQGGVYRPGFGVISGGLAPQAGGPAGIGAASSGNRGASVVGGNHVPGFGVIGGR